jgi:acyl carrier protein
MTTNDRTKLLGEFIGFVREIKGDKLRVPDGGIEGLSLTEDLRLDSLDLINFLFRVEEVHGIKIPAEDLDENELVILGNLAAYVAKRSAAA